MKTGFVLILGLVEPAQGKTRVNLSSERTGPNCTRDGIKYPCAAQCHLSGTGVEDESLAWSRRRVMLAGLSHTEKGGTGNQSKKQVS